MDQYYSPYIPSNLTIHQRLQQQNQQQYALLQQQHQQHLQEQLLRSLHNNLQRGRAMGMMSQRPPQQQHVLPDEKYPVEESGFHSLPAVQRGILLRPSYHHPAQHINDTFLEVPRAAAFEAKPSSPKVDNPIQRTEENDLRGEKEKVEKPEEDPATCSSSSSSDPNAELSENGRRSINSSPNEQGGNGSEVVIQVAQSEQQQQQQEEDELGGKKAESAIILNNRRFSLSFERRNKEAVNSRRLSLGDNFSLKNIREEETEGEEDNDDDDVKRRSMSTSTTDSSSSTVIINNNDDIDEALRTLEQN